MILKRETYIKKYIGSINQSRTNNYKKIGLDKTKYSIKTTGLHGIRRIVNKKFQDTTGYLVQGNIHYSKNNIDRALKSSKQSWERR